MGDAGRRCVEAEQLLRESKLTGLFDRAGEGRGAGSGGDVLPHVCSGDPEFTQQLGPGPLFANFASKRLRIGSNSTTAAGSSVTNTSSMTPLNH